MPDALWQKLHNIADRARPQFKQSFVNAIAKTKQGVSMSGLQQALSSGDVNKAWASLNWEQAVKAQLTPALRDSLVDIIEHSSLASMKDMFGSGMPGRTFDIMNERIYEWVDSEGGSLIQNITQQTKEGINQLVREGYLMGQAPPTQKIFTQLENAAAIRESLGLNKRQMGALNNYRAKLARQGITGPAYNKMVNQYKNDLLMYRAETIARSETIAASFAGQQKLWEAGTASGAIDQSKWEVEWLVTPDDFTCKLCMAMKGKRRLIMGYYPVGRGRGVPYPPLHPRCRCTERLVPKKGAKVFGKVGKPISGTFAGRIPGFGGIGPASPRTLEEGLAQEEALAQAGLLEERIVAQGEEAVAAIQEIGAVQSAGSGARTLAQVQKELRAARKSFNEWTDTLKTLQAAGRTESELATVKAQVQRWAEQKRILLKERTAIRRGGVVPPPPPPIQPPPIQPPPIQPPPPIRTLAQVQKELRVARRDVKRYQARYDELKSRTVRTDEIQREMDELTVKLGNAKVDRARLLLERRAIKRGVQPPPIQPPPPPPPPPVQPPPVGPPVPVFTDVRKARTALTKTRRQIRDIERQIRELDPGDTLNRTRLQSELANKNAEKVAIRKQYYALKKGITPPPPPPPGVQPPTGTQPPISVQPPQPPGPGLPPLDLTSRMAPLGMAGPAPAGYYARQWTLDEMNTLRNAIKYQEGLERLALERIDRMAQGKSVQSWHTQESLAKDLATARYTIKDYEMQFEYLKRLRAVIPEHGLGTNLPPTTKFGQEIRDMATKIHDKGDVTRITKIGERIRQEIATRIERLTYEEKQITARYYGREPLLPGETWDKISAKYHSMVHQEKEIWRKAIKDVISEIRPVGGVKIQRNIEVDPAFESQHGKSYSAGKVKDVEKIFDEIGTLLPDTWVESMNIYRTRPVKVYLRNDSYSGMEGSAAHYSQFDDHIALKQSYLDHETTTHEFFHRIEYDRLIKSSNSWLRDRTKGEKLQKIHSDIDGHKVMGKPDRFFEKYCGRIYGHGHDATETMSMGFEHLFWRPDRIRYSDTGKVDEDYVSFLLGLLGVM